MFRDKFLNLIVSAVSAILVLAVADGCQMDDTKLMGIPSDVVSFVIGGDNLTKSVVVQEQSSEIPADKVFELISNDGKDTLYFRRIVSSMSDEGLFEPKYVTKGAVVTRENVEKFYGNNLYIVAFKNDGSQYIAPQAISYVSRDAQTKISTWKTAEDYAWTSDELYVWGWAPNGGNAGEVNPSLLTNNGLSFKYTSPKGSGEFKDRDAEVQKDAVLAYTVTDHESCGGKIHLVFKHALTAIRFEIGKTNECTINSISLTAMSNGTCTYVQSPVHPVQWSDIQTPVKFTQTFGTEVSEYLIDDDSVQQIDKSEGKPKTFMLIPQSSTDGNKITLEVKLTLKNSGEQVTLTKELDESLTNWEAGKIYTYVLSVASGLEISVADIVNGNTKSNVEISNTYSSTVKCYIRAAIIGNWYDDNGKIVEAWKVEDESFTPALPTSGETTSNNWTKGSDGFYYYKYPVYPGNLTGQTTADEDGDPLFTSYTAPAPSTSGSELNVQIVAQGVQWDASLEFVKEAWGETAATYLSVNDKDSK